MGKAAILLAALALPALAQAPTANLIKPLAVCVDGKCTMTEADYNALKQYHIARVQSLLEAAEVIDQLQAANAHLMLLVTRFAAGCEGRKT